MNRSCLDYRASLQLSLRALLRVGAAGIAGLNLPTLLRVAAAAEGGSLDRVAKAKHVLFLHQFGGPSHIDTFDLKPNAPDGIRGEFKPIATDRPGTTICEHLPRMSRVLGKFAQVRSVSHRVMNHNSATYYSLTGHAPPIDDIRLRDTLDLYPCYGSSVSKLTPASDPAIPTYVSLPHILRDGSVTPGQTASFLGKQFDPFFIGQDPARPDFRLPELSLPANMPIERLSDRRSLLRTIDAQADLLDWSETARGIDAFNDRALTMLASPKVKQAFDLGREKDSLRDAYGRTTYGQSCLLARRLLEAGVRFVTVFFSGSIGNKDAGGWDTHGQNFVGLRDRLLPLTDRTVPTLIDDLAARGLLDETLVVWMGEFGRTPRIKNDPRFGPDGRDHWARCYTVLFAGGGVSGGTIYGASDQVGAYPASDPVTPDDIAATMFWALGIDPSTEVVDRLGRPLPISSGKPIKSLFA